MARTRGQPEGSGAGAATGVPAARACPPQRKQAATRITKAKVLMAAVSICVPLPHLMPRHCKMKNPRMMTTAISLTCPASGGISSPVYSPMTMATAAAVPQVESQSLQPTMNPAYSPNARRAKLYWPPLRGMAAEFGQGRCSRERVESANDPHAEKEIDVGEPQCDVTGSANDSRRDGVANGGGYTEPHAKHFQQATAAAWGGNAVQTATRRGGSGRGR